MSLVRQELGGTRPDGAGDCALALWLLSDVQVLDAASPARCEWVELLAHEPLWQPLLHMHRPYDALAHWSLAAHVAAVRRDPCGPHSRRPYDLALTLGDNIDNAQHNELAAFLAIVSGGTARLDPRGSVQDASGWSGNGPWPFWCPDPAVDDAFKRQGYPAIPHFLERAGAPVHSAGLGFAWTSVPGNHDLMRQGTALPDAAIERIAVGACKPLWRPDGFAPADPLARFVEDPAAFSRGAARPITPDTGRRALDLPAWIAAHAAHGAVGYAARPGPCPGTDTVIDTEHARILLLDTNHPQGDYQGSVGAAQIEWLEHQLDAVDRQPGRFAVLASHHGAASLVNTRGADPQRLQAGPLLACLHRHASLVAWLVGHRHQHAIQAHPGPAGGFWEIGTGSLIDWPVQTRAVEFLRHADGMLEIACTLLDHHAAPDTPAGWHRALARRFAGTQAARMQGTPADRDVHLLRPAPGSAHAAWTR